jgi:hypothetical protein
MRYIKIILLILVALALGAFLWYRYVIRTPEYLIKKAINEIAEMVEKSDGETNSMVAFKMLNLSTYLDERISVSVHDLPIDSELGREEFSSQLARGRMMLRRLNLKVLDILIISRDAQNARVECEVQAKAEGNSGHENRRWFSDNVYHLALDMRCVEGKWLFSGFHEKDILEK